MSIEWTVPMDHRKNSSNLKLSQRRTDPQIRKKADDGAQTQFAETRKGLQLGKKKNKKKKSVNRIGERAVVISYAHSSLSCVINFVVTSF